MNEDRRNDASELQRPDPTPAMGSRASESADADIGTELAEAIQRLRESIQTTRNSGGRRDIQGAVQGGLRRISGELSDKVARTLAEADKSPGHLDPAHCREKAGSIIGRSRTTGGIVAFLVSPIPGVAHVVLNPIETGMIKSIGRVYGYELTRMQA